MIEKASIQPIKVSIRTNICVNYPHGGMCVKSNASFLQGMSLSSVQILTMEVV